MLRRNLDNGRLRFTTSYEEVAAFGDVHFICVGTPQKAGDYSADLTYVDAAINTLAPLLTRDCLIVGVSHSRSIALAIRMVASGCATLADAATSRAITNSASCTTLSRDNTAPAPVAILNRGACGVRRCATRSG